MRKLLWPLLVVNLNITGLIWRGAAYSVQNNTTIILPWDTRRTTSDPFFWRQNRSLETQNGSYISLFANWYCLG